ncbi:hypothetical protein Sjap_021195 [Stephania japonica]|uniref:RRM domain-containing protein n=1 Tax=Stephania japonica TaxID=461633 RepID=A0AAP0F259_9MAGN
MPPRSALRTQRGATKTCSSSCCSKSEIDESSAANAPQNPTHSSNPSGDDESLVQPRPSHRLFDLNEPFYESAEEEEDEKEVIQEEEKPVAKAKEKRKQKEYEVFVGGLHRDANEDDLNHMFNKVGDIVEVRLVKSRYSHKNKGFAFVRFATIDQAKMAASQLNGTLVRGKSCQVTRNNDNETLYLRNICTTWTKDQLVEHLKPFNLEKLEDVHLIDDPNDRAKNRGYAFLNFSTHMDAVAACNRLQKGVIYFDTNIRAEVAFAKSAFEPDEEVMAQVKSVFLGGLPTSWDEEQVLKHFKKYGDIENVKLACNMPSAKRKDFGFISFSTREAALACIDAVNKDGIDEGANKVFLRATLRKPLLKRITPPGGGYISKNPDFWAPRWHTGNSYSSRSTKNVESMGWDHERRSGCLNRYSTRDAYRREFSPTEKYDSQFRRSVRREPATTTANSRGRDPYHESCSSSRHSLDDYEDFATFYPQDDYAACAHPHERYEDDRYYFQYEYCENRSEDGYDYQPPTRLKRPILRQNARIDGPGLEMDDHPVDDVFMYEEYSRSVRDDRYVYVNPGYDSRLISRSTAPRTYRY